MATKSKSVSFVVTTITFIIIAGSLGIFLSCNKHGADKELNEDKKPKCHEIFFEGVGDLPGDCHESTCADISGDGIRVVGSSFANDPLIPNDGKTCTVDESTPTGPRPHSYQAFGWTRPCENINFFPPPKYGNAGMFGFGYGVPGQNATDAESYAYGISPDGKAAVGYTNYDAANNSTAVVFLSGPMARPLARLDITCIALDISESGLSQNNMRENTHTANSPGRFGIIVGYSTTARGEPIKSPGARAVYWDSWDHIVPLPLPSTLPNGMTVISSEAVCVSNDGKIIGGNLYYGRLSDPTHYMSFGCVWKFNSSTHTYNLMQVLRDFSGGDDNTHITHISGNGKLLVGRGNKVAGNPACYNYPAVACLWRLTNDEWSNPVSLALLNGTENSYAFGANYDGSAIVGTCQSATCDFSFFKNSPVIWNGKHPGIAPKDIVAVLGKRIPDDWELHWASRVSDDGRIVIGYGFNSKGGEGWVAGLP